MPKRLVTSRFVFNDDRHAGNPQYPHGWRGGIAVKVRAFNTCFRAQWIVAHRENDWQRMDSATMYNVSPRWAKWFHAYGYYRGNFRYMHHLAIGHVCLSYIPLTNGKQGWWL